MKKSIFILLALVFTQLIQAQCKQFAKNKCLPQLAPYASSGQINTASFSEGEEAEMPLTFYEGNSYRVLVCAQEILGTVTFQLIDANKNVVFDNIKDGGGKSFWDFASTGTQQYTLKIIVPKSEDKGHGLVHTGCLTILVGSKKS